MKTFAFQIINEGKQHQCVFIYDLDRPGIRLTLYRALRNQLDVIGVQHPDPFIVERILDDMTETSTLGGLE